MTEVDPSGERVRYAPLPEGAKGPDIPEKGYAVEEVRDGMFWVNNGVIHSVFFVSDGGVVVVNAPPAIGDGLLAAVREVTDRPVTHFVYSHYQADHVGAAGVFGDTATYVGHRDTARMLERMGDPDRPVPTEVFDEEHTLDVGGQTLELSYEGPWHAPGSVFMYAPRQKALIAIDLVHPGWVPYAYFSVAKDTPGYFAALDRALEYDFDVYVGGHVNRLGSREDYEEGREYALDVRANVIAARKKVSYLDAARTVDADNPWAALKVYRDSIAEEAARTTLEKWLGRLGAADVYTFEHCWWVMSSLDVDENYKEEGRGY